MYEILIVVVGIFTSFFRRPAYVLCRTDAIAEIINSYELEILTLATLSSLKVCCIDFTSGQCMLGWCTFNFNPHDFVLI